MDRREAADPTPNRLLYPLPEAREKLGGISHSNFYNLVADGAIRLTKIGRRSFVSADELEAFVARCTSQNIGAAKEAAHEQGA